MLFADRHRQVISTTEALRCLLQIVHLTRGKRMNFELRIEFPSRRQCADNLTAGIASGGALAAPGSLPVPASRSILGCYC